MRKFGLGLALGLAIGFAGTASAANLIGSSGYLMGWTVTVDGDEVCDSPYAWSSTKEIECD